MRAEWNDRVRPLLRGLAKPLYAAVEFVSFADGVVTFSAPNVTHQQKCADEVAAVQRAWRDATGRDVTVVWSDGSGAATAATATQPEPAPSSPPDDFDAFDEIDESRPALSGSESAFERIAEAFPGAQRIEPQGRE